MYWGIDLYSTPVFGTCIDAYNRCNFHGTDHVIHSGIIQFNVLPHPTHVLYILTADVPMASIDPGSLHYLITGVHSIAIEIQ